MVLLRTQNKKNITINLSVYIIIVIFGYFILLLLLYLDDGDLKSEQMNPGFTRINFIIDLLRKSEQREMLCACYSCCSIIFASLIFFHGGDKKSRKVGLGILSHSHTHTKVNSLFIKNPNR